MRLATRLGYGLLALALLAPVASAQYFGRNKVQYDDFEFRVLRTEHFDVYYYPEEEQAVRDMARAAERWYARLSAVLGHEFNDRKKIIFYADDADFQQTNAITGLIPEGVQGVTEGLKIRVIMPMTASYDETLHVLGHELVHQFQYDIAQRGGQFANFVRLPLWIVEGMAEYFSVGREDVHTAMWLRDAVLRGAFPTLDQLSSDYRFFPYRYGQAFWAYVGGTYGDEAAVDLFKTALAIPLDSAIVSVTGLAPDSLSARWAAAVRAHYLPTVEGKSVPPYNRDQVWLDRDRRRELARAGGEAVPLADSLGLPVMPGRRILAEERGSGSMNIAPQVSPDGRYVAFLSERDLFGVDLFLADAETGQVLKKLQDVSSDPHLDALRFINSAGTWSPDGAKFAFVVFAGGDNELAILDVERRAIERRVKVSGVGAISDPAWSPDGRRIAFTGISGGISDLYLVDVEGGTARQLTNDRHADLQPAWSPDGQTLAFATDRGPGTSFERLRIAPPRIALYSLETGEIRTLSLFEGAKHINPVYSPDGESLYFVSDRGGFSNLYRTALGTGEVFQVTDVATGVSGITALSPTFSIARDTGRLLFSAFEAQDYVVYALEEGEAQGEPVPATPERDVAAAALLPPASAAGSTVVARYLADDLGGLPDTRAFPDRAYRPKLVLDYVSQPTVGAGYDPYYYGGFGVSGGVSFLFSDALSNHVLGVAVQANGSFRDIGGQVLYLNQKRRLNWGAQAAYVPYLQIYQAAPFIENNRIVYPLLYDRTTFAQAAAITQYPLSTSRRVEAQLGLNRVSYDTEIRDQRGNEIETLQSPFSDRATNYAEGAAAFVGDQSFFGFTSPVRGQRYRFGVGGVLGGTSVEGDDRGAFRYASVTADYRRYAFFRPFFTVAARALHFGRYGVSDEAGLLQPVYLGYGTLVRGYRVTTLTNEDYRFLQDRLFGQRVGIGSLELRFPLFGTEQFGLINFPYLPTELVLFGDVGMAWGETRLRGLGLTPGGQIVETSQTFGRALEDARPLYSFGASARVNLLGALVLEFYYAFPVSRQGTPGVFGVNFSPGW